MFIKKIYILIALYFLLSTFMSASIELTSFEQLWNMTAKQNPTLATYKLNTKIAQDNYQASLSYLMPTISANVTAQNNIKIQTTVIDGSLLGQPNETFYAQFNKKYTYTAALTANYAIFDWQQITASRQAKNNVKLQQVEEIYYLQTLKNQTATLYYQTLISLKALEINRKDLTLADTLVVIAEKKYKEGAISLIDLNQAKINYNQIAQNTIASEDLYESNIHQLRILLGLQPGEPIAFSEQLPDKIEQELYSLKKNKLLDTYIYMIKDAEYSLKNEKVANMPKVSLNGYYGADQFQNTFSAFSFKSSNWHGQQYIGLAISMPLFTGFQTLNKMKAAEKNVELVQKQSDIAKQQSDINDHLLLGEIVRKRISAEKAAEAYRLYADNLNMYNIQYQEGAIDIDTFLNYFQNYLISENTYFNQLSNYYSDLSVILSRN